MPRTGLFVADAAAAYPASDCDPIGLLPFAEIAHPVCIDGESAFYDAEGLLDWVRRGRYGESPTTRRPIGVNDLQPIMTSDQVEKYSRSVELLKRLGWNRPDVLEADFARLVLAPRPDELERLKALPVAPVAAPAAGRRRRRSVSLSDGEVEDESLAVMRAIHQSCSEVWAATQNPVLVRQRRELLVWQRFDVRCNYRLIQRYYGSYVPIPPRPFSAPRVTLDLLLDMRERATVGIPHRVLGATRLFDDFCALHAARLPEVVPVTFEEFLRLLHGRLPRARIPSRAPEAECYFYLGPQSLENLFRMVFMHMRDADRALLCSQYWAWGPTWEGAMRRTLDVMYANSAYPVWNVDHLLNGYLDRLIGPLRRHRLEDIQRSPDGENLFRMAPTAADDEMQWPLPPRFNICDDQALETMEVDQLTVPLAQTRFYAPFADVYLVRPP